MSSGSFDSEMELEPRMRTRVPAPLSPAEVCTTTPGARELSASEKVLTAAVVICVASMVAVEAPLSRRRSLCPVAVTTTWSRVVTAGASVKSAVAPSVPTSTARDCGV